MICQRTDHRKVERLVLQTDKASTLKTPRIDQRLPPVLESAGKSRLYHGLKGAGRETQDSHLMLKVLPQGSGILGPPLQPQGEWSTTIGCSIGAQRRIRLLSPRDGILSIALYNYCTKMTRPGHRDLGTGHQAFQVRSDTSQTGWTGNRIFTF